MAVFHARQVAAQQASSLFDVALRHPFLKPVVADGLADIHGREHFRMGHSNQSGNFWQGEICAIRRTFVPCGKPMRVMRNLCSFFDYLYGVKTTTTPITTEKHGETSRRCRSGRWFSDQRKL